MSRQSSTPRMVCVRHAAGFTLIELMIAMLLGLVVIAGVTSVFLAGQQSFRTNNALADVEDGSRIAFELMARDIRQAGLYGCDSSSNRLANVVTGGSTLWYADWNNALHGYDDASTDTALTGITGVGAPVKGQASLHILSAGSITASVSGAPSSAAANLNLNQKSDELQIGDIIIVCSLQGNDAHATMLQITNFNNDNIVVVHNTGSKVSPGNCSKGLGYPTNCDSAVGNGYVFPPNSPIAKLAASDWYIGANSAGGNSLYRVTLSSKADGSGIALSPQEIVRNVCLPADDPSCVGMQITYHAAGSSSYVDAATITTNNSWAAVDSVRVRLSLKSTFQRASVKATPIVRTYSATTTVRNRVD